MCESDRKISRITIEGAISFRPNKETTAMIDLAYYITKFEHTAQAVQALVDGVTEEQAHWKPSEKDRSITEVICHLADEEVEDFRAHVNHMLYHTQEEWPSIDPEGWVTKRNYNQ